MDAPNLMPDVDDLRMIARSVFLECRNDNNHLTARRLSDLNFAHRELRMLGRVDVYDEEFRRHELLLRGFVPPEKF